MKLVVYLQKKLRQESRADDDRQIRGTSCNRREPVTTRQRAAKAMACDRGRFCVEWLLRDYTALK